MKYKQIKNGFITMLGESRAIPETATEITESEYNALMDVIRTKPEDTLESVYRLSAETGQYIPVERTHGETVEWYVQAVGGGMNLEDVPEEYREEVDAVANPTPEPSAEYQAGYDQAVLDLMEMEG